MQVNAVGVCRDPRQRFSHFSDFSHSESNVYGIGLFWLSIGVKTRSESKALTLSVIAVAILRLSVNQSTQRPSLMSNHIFVCLISVANRLSVPKWVAKQSQTIVLISLSLFKVRISWVIVICEELINWIRKYANQRPTSNHRSFNCLLSLISWSAVKSVGIVFKTSDVSTVWAKRGGSQTRTTLQMTWVTISWGDGPPTLSLASRIWAQHVMSIAYSRSAHMFRRFQVFMFVICFRYGFITRFFVVQSTNGIPKKIRKNCRKRSTLVATVPAISFRSIASENCSWYSLWCSSGPEVRLIPSLSLLLLVWTKTDSKTLTNSRVSSSVISKTSCSFSRDQMSRMWYRANTVERSPMSPSTTSLNGSFIYYHLWSRSQMSYLWKCFWAKVAFLRIGSQY